MSWTGDDWINCGEKRIADDPDLASRIIRRGVLLQPGSSVGWYKLGICYHQARKIGASIRAYEHALDQSEAPRSAIEQNLWQDLLLTERWKEGWETMEQRREPELFKAFKEFIGPSWRGSNDD